MRGLLLINVPPRSSLRLHARERHGPVGPKWADDRVDAVRSRARRVRCDDGCAIDARDDPGRRSDRLARRRLRVLGRSRGGDGRHPAACPGCRLRRGSRRFPRRDVGGRAARDAADPAVAARLVPGPDAHRRRERAHAFGLLAAAREHGAARLRRCAAVPGRGPSRLLDEQPDTCGPERWTAGQASRRPQHCRQRRNTDRASPRRLAGGARIAVRSRRRGHRRARRRRRDSVPHPSRSVRSTALGRDDPAAATRGSRHRLLGECRRRRVVVDGRLVHPGDPRRGRHRFAGSRLAHHGVRRREHRGTSGPPRRRHRSSPARRLGRLRRDRRGSRQPGRRACRDRGLPRAASWRAARRVAL